MDASTWVYTLPWDRGAWLALSAASYILKSQRAGLRPGWDQVDVGYQGATSEEGRSKRRPVELFDWLVSTVRSGRRFPLRIRTRNIRGWVVSRVLSVFSRMAWGVCTCERSFPATCSKVILLCSETETGFGVQSMTKV